MRPVTLFTGQWADLPLEALAPLVKSMGYDGVELACWGDHFDVRKALSDGSYIKEKWALLARHGLDCHAISTHPDFTSPSRYWDFRSLGRGDIRFEEIIVALNDIGYSGPLSVEWEDGRMDRIHGATESCSFVRKLDFKSNQAAFDAAFSRK